MCEIENKNKKDEKNVMKSLSEEEEEVNGQKFNPPR